MTPSYVRSVTRVPSAKVVEKICPAGREDSMFESDTEPSYTNLFLALHIEITPSGIGKFNGNISDVLDSRV